MTPVSLYVTPVVIHSLFQQFTLLSRRRISTPVLTKALESQASRIHYTYLGTTFDLHLFLNGK
jgi:hypothetical protein